MKPHTQEQHNLQLEETNQAINITPLPTAVSPKYLYNEAPMEIVISEFSERKADSLINCPPLFTHDKGYKLRLTMCPDGMGNGYVSVHVHLIKGEYDSDLSWPFEGKVVFELLNWRADKNHVSEVLHFCRRYDPCGICTSRVAEGKYSNQGLRVSRFISHSSLLYNPDTNTEYLQDDCVRLRVVDVVVYSTPLLYKTPSWQDSHTATPQSVCEFTLTEFTKRMQLNDEHYSSPFYTHSHGYKMLLCVYAKGQQMHGNYVAVYVCLMRGEYDSDLDWPFEGDVIVELINRREDKKHLPIKVVFDQFTDSEEFTDNRGSSRDRVIEGEVSSHGWGGHIHGQNVFSHSSLPYNPVTNTEYLQDDCLRIRVREVNVHK